MLTSVERWMLEQLARRGAAVAGAWLALPVDAALEALTPLVRRFRRLFLKLWLPRLL
jgi:hypothetical protein